MALHAVDWLARRAAMPWRKSEFSVSGRPFRRPPSFFRRSTATFCPGPFYQKPVCWVGVFSAFLFLLRANARHGCITTVRPRLCAHQGHTTQSCAAVHRSHAASDFNSNSTGLKSTFLQSVRRRPIAPTPDPPAADQICCRRCAVDAGPDPWPNRVVHAALFRCTCTYRTYRTYRLGGLNYSLNK